MTTTTQLQLTVSDILSLAIDAHENFRVAGKHPIAMFAPPKVWVRYWWDKTVYRYDAFPHPHHPDHTKLIIANANKRDEDSAIEAGNFLVQLTNGAGVVHSVLLPIPHPEKQQNALVFCPDGRVAVIDLSTGAEPG